MRLLKSAFSASLLMGAGLMFAAPAQADFLYYRPSLFQDPYLSAADSPFASVDFSSGYFYLENFEDGALNTPGVSSSAGWHVQGPGTWNDSVDADDGVIDHSGWNGKAYRTEDQDYVTFTFDADELGQLPTYVGLVFTDTYGEIPPPTFDGLAFGFSHVGIYGTDGNGNVLDHSIGTLLGDGGIRSHVADDRFIGAYDSNGIATFSVWLPYVAGFWEIDHLQYGYSTQSPFAVSPSLAADVVPEPRSWALMALGFAAAVAFAARRRFERGA